MLPNLGPAEMLIVMGLAVLLFGKRLPEVARSLGKGVVEFKKGLNEVTSGLDDASISNYSSPYQSPARQYDSTARSYDSTADSSFSETAPKFEVPGEVSTTAAAGAVEYQPPASS